MVLIAKVKSQLENEQKYRHLKTKIEKRERGYLLFIDLEKAFDNINR
jgi:hypothetical protein